MFDILIVGAGPSGLCAAKTSLECDNAQVNLRLVDGNKTVGGVWAEENLYPGLKTNNLRGGIDFTDFPMDDSFGVPVGNHIPGEVMHKYFKQYAQMHDVLRRIDFETQVLEVFRPENAEGWNVRVQKPGGESVMQTKRLIISTGVTNDPHRPQLDGADTFDGPILHSAELGKKSASLMMDPYINTVAVIGGGKSGYDAVFLAATSGKQVEWILRKSGKGPGWVFPSHTNFGVFKAWREKLPVRRFISCFSPCLGMGHDATGWLRRLLHCTSLGVKITRAFWADVHHKTLDECGYRKEHSLNILEPDQSLFWYGTHSGVYSYDPELYDFVRSGVVRIHRENITHLTSRTVNLASSIGLSAEAIITATGFSAKPTITFSPTSLHSDIGLPTNSLTQHQRDFWSHLNHKAELTIGASYPCLLIGPVQSPSSNVIQPYNPRIDPELRYTPFRLYRAIAPPGFTTQGDRSLVFIGMFSNVSNTIRLELQCLWAYAYLNNELEINHDTVFDETALLSCYFRYRSPYGHGQFFPDTVFEQVQIFDMYMQDLGLTYWRKGNWFSELFAPYGQDDYKGVVQEWLQAQKRKDAMAGRGGDRG